MKYGGCWNLLLIKKKGLPEVEVVDAACCFRFY